MRLPAMRFTIRGLLAVIAGVAVLLALGRWGHNRYLSPGITKTYYLGDMMRFILPTPKARLASINANLAEAAALLKSSITPDVWWFSTRKVSPFPAAASLTIVHTKEGHQQVAAWLRERRNQYWAAQSPRIDEASETRLSPPTERAVRYANRMNHGWR